MKKIWINSLIVVAMGVFLVILIFFTDGTEQLIKMIKSVNYLWLLVSFSLMILYWVFGACTIATLKRGILGKENNVGHSFKTVMIGQFFSSITPFSTGGQPAQIYFMSKQNIDTGKATSIVIIKSAIYVTTLFITSFIFFIIRRVALTQQIPHFVLLFIIGSFSNLVLIVLYFLFLINRDVSEKIVILFLKVVSYFKKKEKRNVQEQFDKIEESLISFQEGFIIIVKEKFYFLLAYFFQFLQLISIFSVPVFLIRALEGSFYNPMSVIAATGLLMMITSLVPTPGTTGGSEGLGMFFFGKFFSHSPILSAIFIWRIITYYSTILFGGIFSLTTKLKVFSDIKND